MKIETFTGTDRQISGVLNAHWLYPAAFGRIQRGTIGKVVLLETPKRIEMVACLGLTVGDTGVVELQGPHSKYNRRFDVGHELLRQTVSELDSMVPNLDFPDDFRHRDARKQLAAKRYDTLGHAGFIHPLYTDQEFMRFVSQRDEEPTAEVGLGEVIEDGVIIQFPVRGEADPSEEATG